MTATAQLAYGNARVRARKSRLIPPQVLLSMTAADRPETAVEGWRDLGAEGDASSLMAMAYSRLADEYDAVIRAYPIAAAVLRALVRLHDLENVKLAWRAAACGAPAAHWESLWRPLGSLATVSLGRAPTASLPQLTSAFSTTPFAGITEAVLRAHANDLAAAEMAFDRWGSEALAAAGSRLPAREGAARSLVSAVVCERDAAVFERAIGPLDVAPDTALRMTSRLGDAIGANALRMLATQTVGRPAVLVILPRSLSRERRAVGTLAELRHAIRRGRRLACEHAFLQDPFSLAPPIALVLMREDELHALISVAELRSRRASRRVAARVVGAWVGPADGTPALRDRNG